MSFGIPVRNGLAIGLLSSTTLSSNGGLFPAMSLDFLQPYLDSRVTFTRGSNATLVDSTGKIVYAPANLLTQSQTFDNAGAWTLEGSTLSSGQIAPDGTATAYLFTATAASGNRRITQVISQVVSVSYVRSIWIRRVTGTGAINLRSPTGSDVDITSQISATWNRIAVSGTATGASNFILAFSVTGDAIEIWGAQVEPVTYQTTPGTYNATTSAAYYGPRFDYDPVTLAPKGLLIEEQRVNLVLYSQQFDQVDWLKEAGVTVTANTAVAPDGTFTADTVNPSGNSAEILRQQTLSAGTYTLSVWLSGSGTVKIGFFNAIDGVQDSASITLTSTLTRYSLTKTLSAGVNSAYPVTTRGAATVTSLVMWGAQLEAGSFATSYIPTVASQVTRSADVASMTGTNFSSWFNTTQGTFVTSADVGSVASGDKYVLIVNDANGRITYVSTAAINTFDGTTVTSSGQSASANTPFKSATAWSGSTLSISANGAAAVGGAFDGAFGAGTELRIGSNNGSTAINGHVRSIAYFNTRLTNTQLVSLTT